MGVIKYFLFPNIDLKRQLFSPKFDSRLVNADWLITWQVKQTLDYVN